MPHWTPDDIEWNRFDKSKADNDTIKIIKTAALIEYNAQDYDAYLASVFAQEIDFKKDSQQWAKEEIQHGHTLATWAGMADPTFDFHRALRTFQNGFQLPQHVHQSVRGSLSGEMIARCIVEAGTSSFYSSIAQHTQEPVLKDICQKIAADEFRHYKLFYRYLKTYMPKENISFFNRLRVALGRMLEADDDEIATAYYAANVASHDPDTPFSREDNARAYFSRLRPMYQPIHMQRACQMIAKATGFNPQGWSPVILYNGMRFYMNRFKKTS